MGKGAYAAEYDQNGNMTSRVVAGQAQVLEWDAENRLVRVTQGASVSTYVYDGDGNRVQATVDGVTTVYIGGYYEETAGTIRTYYYHGGERVAMREAGVTTWLLGDHLGSTSVAYRASDGQTTTQRYYAWGGIGPGPENELPTDYTFTGQRLDSCTNLYKMGSRWYDAQLGRWVSPDTIVPEPGNPQSLDRYSFVLNNPPRYTDPTGHYYVFPDEDPRHAVMSWPPRRPAPPSPSPLPTATVATKPAVAADPAVVLILRQVMHGEEASAGEKEKLMLSAGWTLRSRVETWGGTYFSQATAPDQYAVTPLEGYWTEEGYVKGVNDLEASGDEAWASTLEPALMVALGESNPNKDCPGAVFFCNIDNRAQALGFEDWLNEGRNPETGELLVGPGNWGYLKGNTWLYYYSGEYIPSKNGWIAVRK